MNILNKIKTKDVVYLSSKMTGEEAFGYPMFYAMEKAIKDAFGCSIINPARHFNGRTDLKYEVYLKHDFKKMIEKATCVVVFGNWRKSKGALKEVLIAMSTGIRCYEKIGVDLIDIKESELNIIRLLADLYPVSETVCQEADRLVSSDRGNDYGHPYDDYKRTTETFNALSGHNLSPLDGIMFMVCVKLSRLRHKFKRDSLVDAIGYLKCFEMSIKKGG